MMMSVFQEGALLSLDHLACMKIAATADDVELVSWSFIHGKPACVGLGGKPSIIKPEESGDQGLSFEALFDHALTLTEYRRMKKQGANTMDELKPRHYRVRLVAEISSYPYASFLLKATSDTDVSVRLKRLVNDDAFRRQLTLSLAEHLFTVEDIRLVSAGAALLADSAPDEAPEYEFLTPDAD